MRVGSRPRHETTCSRATRPPRSASDGAGTAERARDLLAPEEVAVRGVVDVDADAAVHVLGAVDDVEARLGAPPARDQRSALGVRGRGRRVGVARQRLPQRHPHRLDVDAAVGELVLDGLERRRADDRTARARRCTTPPAASRRPRRPAGRPRGRASRAAGPRRTTRRRAGPQPAPGCRRRARWPARSWVVVSASSHSPAAVSTRKSPGPSVGGGRDQHVLAALRVTARPPSRR